MMKPILKGLVALFVLFCVVTTAVALWRAFAGTSGAAVTATSIDRNADDIYAMVSDMDEFPDWSGWRQRDPKAVFAMQGSDQRPTLCWTGEELGTGCLTPGPADPDQRVMWFSLSPAIVKDGAPRPRPATIETYQGGDEMGAYRVVIDPAGESAVVTLTYQAPEHRGLFARLLSLVSQGEAEARGAAMLSSLKARMQQAGS